MSDRILDDIDHAIRDYEVGKDAMRWTPEPQPEPERIPWVQRRSTSPPPSAEQMVEALTLWRQRKARQERQQT